MGGRSGASSGQDFKKVQVCSVAERRDTGEGTGQGVYGVREEEDVRRAGVVGVRARAGAKTDLTVIRKAGGQDCGGEGKDN